jgi:nitrate reductase (cytochrome), electron transfer subunit
VNRGGDDPGRSVAVRVVAIASVVAVMVGAVITLAPPTDRVDPTGVATAPDRPVDRPVAGPPIAAEAGVFRLDPRQLAAGADTERRPEAHPRTLAMYRSLRAFPGAPPRVPHGLTADEYREGRCVVCHERGGYVERFAAYAPVAPHPELRECLQCHVPDDALVGLDFPDHAEPGGVCFQCHILDAAVPVFRAIDWQPAPWPAPGASALPGSPPTIPHAFQLRENCLACHAGAGAVEEIRTSHGARGNCRQCHVPAPEGAGEFNRPGVPASRVAEGGA